MFGWFNRFGRNEAERPRPGQSDSLGVAETLERRLVLGMLAPLPAFTIAEPGDLQLHAATERGTSSSQAGYAGSGSAEVTQAPARTRAVRLNPDHSVTRALTAPSVRAPSVRPLVHDSILGEPTENNATERPDHREHRESIRVPQIESRLHTSTGTTATAAVPEIDRHPSRSSSPSSTAGIEHALLNWSQGIFFTRDVRQHGAGASQIPWFEQESAPVQIRYDFRDLNGIANEISDQQQAVVAEVLAAWTDATGGQIQWVRDTNAADDEVVIIGTGDLKAVDLHSAEGGTLGVGGGQIHTGEQGLKVIGTVWLDRAENWDNNIENGDPAGTVDFFTVMAHETGHVIGLQDRISPDGRGIMDPGYTVERSREAISEALHGAVFFPMNQDRGVTGYSLNNMIMGFPQLAQSEVDALLRRASAATSSEDAIIAVVDRNGTILGVRAEQEVLDTFTDPAELAFAIDGAVSKARTAAFFANDTAPLTSRLVRFISQSTVTEREVDSNPNITDADSTERGPGFVAPIGLGGHFPPDINFTPPVDLFGIEHTNRDSLRTPGPDRIMGTGDDVLLPYRFNIDPLDVPAGQEIVAPLSYGDDAGIDGSFQNRGIATLPGGVPIFRDTDLDGVGDTLIGGIGVFFPGPDGYATFEQGYVAGARQTTKERTNAPKVLEAEFIAVAAVGGSREAARQVPAARAVEIAGIPPVDGLDLPFGCLSLVGINLQVIGPQAGILGVERLAAFARNNLEPGTDSGSNQVLGGGAFLRDGASVADGFLMTSQSSTTDDLTAADVDQIIDAAIAAADEVRAAVRLDPDRSPGARTRMVFAITDTTGELLGLYRMEDATVFSIDVAVAKARNVAYYADAAALQPDDQIAGVDAGTAFTNRTFRFVSEPRFPDGIDGTAPPPFSILQDADAAGIDPRTGENLGAPAPASAFESVLGFDAFHPGTNFQDPDNLANQNGIVFFPGSTPLYKDGVLVGGLGVSGDGVDQDDVVTFLAAQGFLPDGVTVQRADQVLVDGVRLPYVKFLRNPFG